LGPACWEIPQLESLIDAGLSIARFNFSHGDHEGHQACLDRLRQAAKNKNKHIGTSSALVELRAMNLSFRLIQYLFLSLLTHLSFSLISSFVYTSAVMLDTKGPEIRSGFFADGAKKISLEKGETIVLTSDYSFKGSNRKLACSYQALAKSVRPGQQILVADGSLVLRVLSIDEAAGEVTCRIENSATIGERKNMNLPGVVVDLPTLTEKDISDIQDWGVKNQVDFIAASFVRKASDVHKIREVLGEEGKGIKIICKIENQEGMENYDAILEATDSIMVARGDLGMEIPPEKVFLAQKMMIRKANIAGKPVVTATQMLESMITNPRPTRAECSDVANAVLDGTDCVMLSGETANGEHPTAAVTIMSETCVEAEGAQNTNMLYQAVRNSTLSRYGHLSTSESIASSAVKTAIDVGAKAIIVVSESGTTAAQVAKFRPGRPIHVITHSEQVARQCCGYLRSAEAHMVSDMSKMDQAIDDLIEQFKSTGFANPGDAIVVVTGTIKQKGATNLMRVHYA
jgi:pyruvate kinase